MAEIKIERRVKYAGDVYAALVDAGWEPEAAGSFLNSFPDAAEAAPVVHGRWDDSGRYIFSDGSTAVRCTVCGCSITKKEYAEYNWNFCPVCGATMDGAKDG